MFCILGIVSQHIILKKWNEDSTDRGKSLECLGTREYARLQVLLAALAFHVGNTLWDLSFAALNVLAMGNLFLQQALWNSSKTKNQITTWRYAKHCRPKSRGPDTDLPVQFLRKTQLESKFLESTPCRRIHPKQLCKRREFIIGRLRVNNLHRAAFLHLLGPRLLDDFRQLLASRFLAGPCHLQRAQGFTKLNQFRNKTLHIDRWRSQELTARTFRFRALLATSCSDLRNSESHTQAATPSWQSNAKHQKSSTHHHSH